MCTTTPEFPTFLESFLHRYKTEFGFVLQNRDVLVDDFRVRGIGKTQFEDEHESIKDVPEPTESPGPVETANVFFDDQCLQTAVYKMEDLLPGKFKFLLLLLSRVRTYNQDFSYNSARWKWYQALIWLKQQRII